MSEPPNELWHIDMKGLFNLAGTHRRISCHFAGLVDDHSRYLLGIRAVPTAVTGARTS